MKQIIYLMLMLVLIGLVSAEYHIDIKADYINESKVTVTDVDIHRLSYNIWRLNSTNANYAIQRAKVIEQLYDDELKLLNTSIGLTYLKVSNVSDIGRNGMYMRLSMSARGDDVCNAGDPLSRSNVVLTNSADCSSWSDMSARYDYFVAGEPTSYGYFYLDSTLINTVVGISNLGTYYSNEIGTDTSTDDRSIDYYNLTNYMADHTSTWSGSQASTAILFCTTNLSEYTTYNRSTTCVNDFGAPFVITRNRVLIDFYNDFSIPFTSSPSIIVSFYPLNPLNGTGINATKLLDFTLYNVNTSATCNISLEGVSKQQLSGLGNGTHNFSSLEGEWVDGFNNITVYCNDTSNNATDFKTLYVDTVLPDILYMNYTSGGISHELNNSVFAGDVLNLIISTNDTNNKYFNLSMIDQDGIIQYSYQNESIDTQLYLYNETIEIPKGIYNVTVVAKDSYNNVYMNSVTLTVGFEYVRLSLNNCSDSLDTLLFVYRFKNETSRDNITSDAVAVINLTYPTTGDSYNIILQVSDQYNITVCGNLTQEVLYTAYIQYGEVYTLRYYAENVAIQPVTQYIDLYVQGESTASVLQQTVLDYSYNYANNIIVKMQRYYPQVNQWIQVQMYKTDQQGQTLFYVIEEDVDYRYLLEYDGVVILTTSAEAYLCDFGVCTETLYSGLDVSGLVLNPIPVGLITFNNDTKIFRFEFNDPNNAASGFRLDVYRNPYTENILVCSQTGLGSSGVVYCNVENYTAYDLLAQGKYTGSPQKILDSLYQAGQAIKEAFQIFKTYDQFEGLFWGFLLILTTILIAVYSIEIALLGAVVVIIMLNLMGVTALTQIFIYSFGAIAIFIIYLFNKR